MMKMMTATMMMLLKLLLLLMAVVLLLLVVMMVVILLPRSAVLCNTESIGNSTIFRVILGGVRNLQDSDPGRSRLDFNGRIISLRLAAAKHSCVQAYELTASIFHSADISAYKPSARSAAHANRQENIRSGGGAKLKNVPTPAPSPCYALS